MCEETVRDSYFYEWLVEKGLETGEVPRWVQERVVTADVPVLDRRAVNALRAGSIEECFD